MNTKEIRIALLDMNNNHPNQGMKNITDLVEAFKETSKGEVQIDKFNVRYSCSVPKVKDYDIFISSGGPGTPHREGFIWEEKYTQFLESLWKYNLENEDKKYAFLICHSFQLAVIHWNLATVNTRKSYSFGVMPIHKTEEGKDEYLFKNLADPFWAIDSRAYQCVQPNDDQLNEMGMKIVALEKVRPHIDLERAVMAIRFSNEIFGTQFHPEADSQGFLENLKDENNKQTMIKNYGLRKYKETVDRIDDEDKIVKTQAQIIPRFLAEAFQKIADYRKDLEKSDEMKVKTKRLKIKL